MQENNVIYEISQKMQDKEIVQNDMKEALGLVTNLFKTKYIDKIDCELKTNIKNIQNNPTKEIVLLNALKPFAEKDSHKNIDNIINLVTNITAFKNLIPKQQPKFEQNIIKANNLDIDPSVKEDGVYDIDENCLFYVNNSSNKQNSLIFFVFLLLFLMPATNKAM